MASRQFKANNISDEAIYKYIEGLKPSSYGIKSAWLSGVCDLLPDYPYKIVLAKLRQMINKKRLEGCACGCYEGFQIPDHIRRLRLKS